MNYRTALLNKQQKKQANERTQINEDRECNMDISKWATDNSVIF